MLQRFALLSLVTLCCHSIGYAQLDISTPNSSKPSTRPRTVVRKSKSTSPNQTSKIKRRMFGTGLDLGSNATYGNGLKLFFDPFPFIGIEAGVGYNSTGAKYGGSGVAMIPLGSSFVIDGGGGYVFSSGNNSKVGVPAKFTPENGTQEEVTASKNFKLTPGQYVSAFAGMRYGFTPAIWAALRVNYNKLVKGHVAEFYGRTEYDTPIDPTNESEAEEKFKDKARNKLNVTGLGFSLGLQFRM
jgi:hypothetical protein